MDTERCPTFWSPTKLLGPAVTPPPPFLAKFLFPSVAPLMEFTTYLAITAILFPISLSVALFLFMVRCAQESEDQCLLGRTWYVCGPSVRDGGFLLRCSRPVRQAAGSHWGAKGGAEGHVHGEVSDVFLQGSTLMGLGKLVCFFTCPINLRGKGRVAHMTGN